METAKNNVMELPYTRFVLETKTVELPLCRIHKMFAYKIVDKDTCIMVTHNSMFGPKIEQVSASLAFQFSETEDCTEGEFQSRFNYAMEQLVDLSVK